MKLIFGFIIFTFYNAIAFSQEFHGMTQHIFGFTSPYSTSKKEMIYGLAGNVAEITLDKKVLGGSWYHSVENCLTGKTTDHDPNIAANWLGFRCVVSFNPEDSPERTDSQTVISVNFDWLMGHWKRINEKEGRETFENWTKKSKSEYFGLGYTLQNKDTIFKENISLKKENGIWNFSVLLKGESIATTFKLIKIEKDRFTCSNKNNEFPKQIQYFVIENRLKALISGGELQILFEFEKVNNPDK